MRRTAQQEMNTKAPVRAANGAFGASVAYGLWEQAEAAMALVDYSSGQQAYEHSVFRLPERHRQLAAALHYVATVEASGHAGYFESCYSIAFEDACAAFETIGARDIVDIMKEAEVAVGTVVAVANGGELAEAFSASHDAALAQVNPVAALESYVRRFRADFERW